MTVSATTATTSTTPTTTTKTAADNNDSNYQTFLKMMTTQIKNQDPLNPTNADQLAVQLATFSQVEQQTKTNDLLTQMISANTQTQMGQMAGWVGQQAETDTPVVFDGQSAVRINTNPDTSADKVMLVVKDEGGNVVDQTEIPKGAGSYNWGGHDSSGNPLAAGNYTLTTESYANNQLIDSQDVTHYATIDEVRAGTAGSSGVQVVLNGGIEVAASSILALRAAGT